jgi:hypothetical protein
LIERLPDALMNSFPLAAGIHQREKMIQHHDYIRQQSF